MNNNKASDKLKTIMDFGLQPRCFDYIENKDNDLKLFNFTLCQSKKSGLLQLGNPIPAESLKPNYSWIQNKEPDDHAYLIAEQVLKYASNNDAKVLFLSKYDKTVYELVKESLGSRAILLDANKDLGILDTNPNQALIQEKINLNNLEHLSSFFGQFDIIVTSRLLEHANNIHSFVNVLTGLLKEDGKIIVEVPDSTKSLLQGDVAMLWEEHTYYFTPESLRLEFDLLGYSIENYILYNYPQEDALIGIFNRNKNSSIEKTSSSLPFGEYTIANIFKKKVEYLQYELNNQLSSLKDKFGEIVIFGAGHRAIMFINLLGVSNLISFVIDDDPNKNNLKIPPTGIEIKNSEEINLNDVGVCIFAISLNAEEKVKKVLSQKINRKIKYYSISPDSQYFLPIFNRL
ncbi:MAG: hypothetical protein QF864_16340 [SAR202 cluster bacterium]|nr:hypothetical protein [SAR202 cluster bacterium]